MRDMNTWEMKRANLRGKTLNFEEFIPWDNYSNQIKLTLLEFFSLSNHSTDINNGLSKLSTETTKALNQRLFSYNPSLWFCFAASSSEFSNEMIVLQLKLLELLQKCHGIKISDLKNPDISNTTLKTLWTLKDRSASLFKTFLGFQDYYEKFQMKETEINECKKHYTYFITTLGSLLYSSLKPLNAELDILISMNLELIKNAVIRNKIRSNYKYFDIQYNEYNPVVIKKTFLEDFEEGGLEQAIYVLGNVNRIYSGFFWAIEATVDDFFSELDYWTKFIPSDPEFDEIMIKKIFDKQTIKIIPPSLLPIWREIELCYKVKAFSACAILLRKLLENRIRKKWFEKYHSIDQLKDKDGTPKSLDYLIKQSENVGLLSKSLASNAQRIRFYGGIQAHDSYILNADQSEVLNGINTLKAIFQRLNFYDV